MRIGLINIEPKIVNTAYMQIAQYHKQQGHAVEWWDHAVNPICEALYDKIYCSSLFTFSDHSGIPERAICGGTGYDTQTNLPDGIENCSYDYSLYPDCDYSIVWFSRGCIRQCPFCVVQRKEGKIGPVKPKPLNPNGKYIVVQDNNFFANPQWEQSIDQLVEWGQPVDFQGVDIRLLHDKRKIQSLLKLKHYRQVKFAWDNPRDQIELYLHEVLRYIKPCYLMCYVLIGYWSDPCEDMYRVEYLSKLGVRPYVMAFDKTDPYQKAFSRWVNAFIYKSCKWEDYQYNPKRRIA